MAANIDRLTQWIIDTNNELTDNQVRPREDLTRPSLRLGLRGSMR